MSDWTELREHYRPHVEAFIDDLILRGDDRQLRAHLAAHRETAIERMLDAVEIGVYKRLLAQRDEAHGMSEHSILPMALNGHRVFKVGKRSGA
jgi:hypothetical protein